MSRRQPLCVDVQDGWPERTQTIRQSTSLRIARAVAMRAAWRVHDPLPVCIGRRVYRVGMPRVNTKRRNTCASRVDPSDPSIACLVERRRSLAPRRNSRVNPMLRCLLRSSDVHLRPCPCGRRVPRVLVREKSNECMRTTAGPKSYDTMSGPRPRTRAQGGLVRTSLPTTHKGLTRPPERNGTRTDKRARGRAGLNTCKTATRHGRRGVPRLCQRTRPAHPYGVWTLS